MSNDPTLNELQKRISELELEKKNLLKLVSHDVKSPFNKLFALSNLLRLTADNLGEEQQEYLTRMDWVIKEGLTVIRNLMDLRAIEENKIELSLEQLHFDSIISDTLKNYSKQTTAKKIDFDQNIGKVTVWSDKRLLDRVIDHLISNAIKFSPINSKVSINLTQQSKSISFEISSESGPIPSEEESRMFLKNASISIRPTHGESALGNGLYIAQIYANKLGGIIEVKQEDKMVKFVFTLPIKESAI